MHEGVRDISVLRNLEQRIENLVEGVFSRAFSSQVQPVEIARKLAKEMDSHRTASISRVYVPNQYTVWLSTEDHKRFEGYERSLGQEMSAYLLEHARRHDYALLTRPEVNLEVDDRLRLGEFGIQARLVKPPQREGEQPSQGGEGHTMVYSVPPKQPRAERKRPAAHLTTTKAIVSMDDRRYVLDGPIAVLGRSREADCVFADPNVSREHAELRRQQTGDWQIVDLGSTNGVKVNGRQVDSARLSPGDEVTIGTTYFTFDIEQ
jgi:FHA domain-containing protein